MNRYLYIYIYIFLIYSRSEGKTRYCLVFLLCFKGKVILFLFVLVYLCEFEFHGPPSLCIMIPFSSPVAASVYLLIAKTNTPIWGVSVM